VRSIETEVWSIEMPLENRKPRSFLAGRAKPVEQLVNSFLCRQVLLAARQEHDGISPS
jgi:hypothetical protein